MQRSRPLRLRPVVLLAAFVMGVGVGALVFSLAGSENGPRRGALPAPIAAPSPEGQAAPAEGAGGDPPAATPRVTVLELGASSSERPGGRLPSDPRVAGDSRAGPASPAGLLPLGSGTGRIRFAVRDGAGRPLGGVSVSLRALDARGGVGQAITGRRGEAEFVDLAAGVYAYRVEPPDRPQGASEATVRLAEGERAMVPVRLAGSNLSIEGRVLNRGGRPIQGIEVTATRHRFASSLSESFSDSEVLRANRTRRDGTFRIGGLAEGEYLLETTATSRYPSTKRTVQAGAPATDLILAEVLRVHGTITDQDGLLLARVWVGLQANRDRFTYSDSDGAYQLDLEPAEAASTVRFYLQGYEEQLIELGTPDPEGPPGIRLDARLGVVEDGATVSGVVETERGAPLAGASILLRSEKLGTHYQAASDERGRFSIPRVTIGAGYHLRVLPGGPYRDHARSGLSVGEDGLTLEIALDSLPTGRLTGRMVDSNGYPVPDFRIWVLSREATRAAAPITGDEGGFFTVDEAAAGPLVFDTRSSPRFVVRGVELPVGGEKHVTLVLDWGEHEMAGEIVDGRGDPVAGADVSLSWSHSEGDTQSTSQRATRSDQAGRFRFTQLGPGEHRLDVRAAGYRAAQDRHQVGRYSDELEVRLEREQP